MEYQLRDYQIRPGELEQWVEEWKKMVCPLRTSFGFAVVGAWTIEESERSSGSSRGVDLAASRKPTVPTTRRQSALI